LNVGKPPANKVDLT